MRTSLRLSSLTIPQTLFPVARPNVRRASSFTCYILIALVLPSFLGAQTNGASEPIRVVNAHGNGWIQAPGVLVRPDCIHEVPLGADVDMQGNVKVAGATIAHFNPCPEAPIKIRRPSMLQSNTQLPSTNGWLFDLNFQDPLPSTDNIDYFYSNWSVPAAPTQSGGLIYIANGIEPDSQDWIFEPVLQYGYNGVNSWQIGAWMVSSNGYVFRSPFVGVSPGDQIWGYIWLNSQSGDTLHYEVSITDSTSGANAWITGHTTGLHWTWAYAGTVAAYNISSCAQLPNTTGIPFSNALGVYHGFPEFFYDQANWTGYLDPFFNPYCGYISTADSGGGSFIFSPY